MSKRENLDKAARRGQEAKRIMDSEIVQETFENMEKGFMQAMMQTEGDEHSVRERIYLMNRLLREFKQQFTTTLANGKFASEELLEILRNDDEIGK